MGGILSGYQARAVAAFILGALCVSALPAPTVGAQPGAQLLARLGDTVTVTRNDGTGHVGFLGGTSARPLATSDSLGRPSSARLASSTFLARYAPLFGVTDAARDLHVTGTSRVAGRTFVRYQQTYHGLPVISGELNVQVSRTNDIISVNGEASPDLSLDTDPSIAPSRARVLAIAATARQEKVKPATLRAGPATLAIYDAGLTGDPRALPGGRLAWRVDVRSARRPIDEWVAIEASRGVVLAAFNQIDAAIPEDATQRVCDASNVRATAGEGSTDPLQCDPSDEPTIVADPGSSQDADILGAYRGAEATYDFYAKHFGRSSLDGAGMTLVSTVRYCTESTVSLCPYANAFWNGVQMYYGEGFASADKYQFPHWSARRTAPRRHEQTHPVFYRDRWRQ